ncbi:MAG: hypothetical protein E7328_00025 [Clostridiales bacterium]|nr:hypothetical protein [Clostridiales bacterium]
MTQCVEPHLCCGCAVCAAVCPAGAITMKRDDEGFLYPGVSNSCIDCGLCVEKCPVCAVEGIRMADHGLSAYAAHGAEEGEQLSCASGGVATAISKKVLKAGGVVYGVAYGENYRSTRYIRVEREEELELLKGSKYIQSEKDGLWQGVEEELQTGRLTLFVGMPCDVAALKAYLGREYENLIACELICHGITSPKVQGDYLDDLERQMGAATAYFTVRYKKDGWYPPHIKAVMENGKEEIVPFYATSFGYAYEYFLRPSCNNCTFKGENRCGDITLGDYLGMTKDHPGYSEGGISAVMINSEKARPFVEDLPNMVYTPVPYEEIVACNKRMSIPARPKPQREEVRLWVCGEGLAKGFAAKEEKGPVGPKPQ